MLPLSYPLNMALRSRIIAHQVARVESVALSSDPFPHILLSEFFPDDVYAAMVGGLPLLSSFEPFQYRKHHLQDGSSNRRRFVFDNQWLLRLDRPRQELWFAVRSALGSVEVKQAVFRKLAPGLTFRYGEQPAGAQSLPGYALPELFHESSGYRIAPHPDTRKKVVTMQISLAGDREHAHLGTEFYRRSFQPAHWLREPRGFEVVKTTPFLPNAAYAFVVLNSLSLKSWHGRSTILGDQVARNTILNIWYQRPELACMDLVHEQAALSPQRQAA